MRGGSVWRSAQCSRKASEGEWCSIHSPATTAKRRARIDARIDAMMTSIDRQNALAKERDRQAALYPKLMKRIEVLQADVKRLKAELAACTSFPHARLEK